MITLESDGLLSVVNPPSGSLSFQADYLARQHPANLSDVRDFYDLSHRYYEKLIAAQFPEIAVERKVERERRAEWMQRW